LVENERRLILTKFGTKTDLHESMIIKEIKAYPVSRSLVF